MDVHGVNHLVVDSGAFIKQAPLQDIGNNIYSIAEVVSEIRDKATRQNLQVLSYELHFRQPSQEAIKFVTDFSKKTGDYRSLSAVDIKVLALTYQLEKEHVGTSHIRTEPKSTITIQTTKKTAINPTTVPGFYSPASDKGKVVSDEKVVQEPREEEAESSHADEASRDDAAVDTNELVSTLTGIRLRPAGSCGDAADTAEHQGRLVCADDAHESQEVAAVVPPGGEPVQECEEVVGNDSQTDQFVDGAVEQSSQSGDEDEEDEDEGVDLSGEDEEADKADEDDSGWITPDNIKKVKMEAEGEELKANVQVGCITTDFSMQNVLIQMGLHVVSMNGMLITNVRTYVLRCYSCFKITTVMTKQFCPNCGNSTLKRVSVSVDKDGNTHYHISTRRPINIRGSKYALPAPRGGKHGVNPLLCEDQRVPHNRQGRKAAERVDPLATNYSVRASPFATRDVTSRAAQLHQQGAAGGTTESWMRRNPNDSRRRIGKKKKMKG